MTTAIEFPLTLFLHYDDGSGEIQSEIVNLACTSEDQARFLSEHFYDGTIFDVWEQIPEHVRERVTARGIDAGIAVSGAVSVNGDDYTRYTGKEA